MHFVISTNGLRRATKRPSLNCAETIEKSRIFHAALRLQSDAWLCPLLSLIVGRGYVSLRHCPQ
tara:strand:- start:1163 stop:1354 length:192 start_codon:yes stop_codon:yes gene_type:complete